MKSNIKEALKLVPLSEEEKASRHIIGRLYGPLGTTKEKTRNGRFYSEELWKKELNSELFKEGLDNKSLMLELGHPLDGRLETDMMRVCAEIDTPPKVIDGVVYGVIDIVDTPAGRQLKTLCDYGFVPGISSRGEGDVDDEGYVDPETFFLKTWDIVQTPANKGARLSVCESLNNKESMKKALAKLYKNSSDEEIKIMEESLQKLTEDKLKTVNISEDEFYRQFPGEKISFFAGKEVTEDLSSDDTKPEEIKGAAPEEKPTTEDKLIPVEEPNEEEIPTEPIENTPEEGTQPEDETIVVNTVGELIDTLKALNADAKVSISNAAINNREYSVSDVVITTNDDNGVTLNFTYIPVDGIKDSVPEENSELTEARKSGADPKTLKSYRNTIVKCFKRLKEAKREIQKLNTARNSRVEELEEEVARLTKRNTTYRRVAKESINLRVENSKLKHDSDKYAEQIDALKAETETVTESYNKLKELATQKLGESIKLAENYKTKYSDVLSEYIRGKAQMLGVSTRRITEALDENFTVEDVNKVCKDIINRGQTLPQFSLDSDTKVRITESAEVNTFKDTTNTANIDPILYELAGLK